MLADVDPGTGLGTLIGVIGGYQQGGRTDAVSYAARLGATVAALYQTALYQTALYQVAVSRGLSPGSPAASNGALTDQSPQF